MHSKDTKLDFTGQDIFVALDTGKRTWKTCIMTDELELKTCTQPPKVDRLISYLHRNYPGARYHCVYEAGYSGYWIHDELKERGADCIVVNPADVPTKHKERRYKTNGVDARKLCRTFRNGELTGIYVPTRTSLEDRSLIRNRYGFVKKQTRCKNQIKSLLSFYGFNVPEELATAHWSRNFIAWLQQLTFARPSGDQALKSLLEELLYLRQIIVRLTTQIRALSETEPYRTSVGYLRSVHGISTLSAMVFLTELVEIARFRTLDQLANYCGLVPDERSTGEEQNILGLTSRRNPLLRALLIECAWTSIRKDPALLMAFNKLSTRMPKTKAIIRIARKLLNRIRFVLKNQQPYQDCVVQS